MRNVNSARIKIRDYVFDTDYENRNANIAPSFGAYEGSVPSKRFAFSIRSNRICPRNVRLRNKRKLVVTVICRFEVEFLQLGGFDRSGDFRRWWNRTIEKVFFLTKRSVVRAQTQRSAFRRARVAE